MSDEKVPVARKFPLSRRAVLRGALGGATVGVGLPLLDVFLDGTGRALADGSAFPRRFISWFWGNGAHPLNWNPEGSPTTDITREDFAWPQLWEPLRRHAAKATFITRYNVKTQPRFPHTSASSGMFAGAPLEVVGDRGVWQAPTIDQLIADVVGRDTRFRSLHFSGTETTATVSYRGREQPNPSEPSPYRAYERLFTDGFRLPGEDAVIDPTLALRRSVLDAVADDSRRLQGRLGLADRIRLDQHFTAIRELELRLHRLEQDPPSYASCALPTLPPTDIPTDGRGRQQVGLRNALMAELAAMAMACDQSRVVSYLLSVSVGDTVFPIDGLEVVEDGVPVLKGHHELTHNEPGEEMPRVHEIVLYIMERLAEFADALDAIPEGEETLLDHTLLLASTDASNPRTHSLANFPVILLGGASGRLRTGVHVEGNGDNASRILMSAARAVGVNLPSIGMEEGLVTDGVPELEPDV